MYYDLKHKKAWECQIVIFCILHSWQGAKYAWHSQTFTTQEKSPEHAFNFEMMFDEN